MLILLSFYLSKILKAGLLLVAWSIFTLLYCGIYTSTEVQDLNTSSTTVGQYVRSAVSEVHCTGVS